MGADRHVSVMLCEAVGALNVRDNGVYVDATLGDGGYTRAILEAADTACVYAFDRDPTAIAAAERWAVGYGERLRLINRPFADMEAALAGFDVTEVDGVAFDIGVSSMHLDDAERGFSFLKDGPLSMRMDGGRPDAADVVAQEDDKALAAVFQAYGEERHAGRIARAIVKAREHAPIETTLALAKIVEDATPGAKGSKIHPATRVFQALRIFVNDELGQLVAGLRAAERLLKPAGRLVVVTFHSLEDRIVKRFFASRSAVRAGGSRHQPEPQLSPATFAMAHSGALAPTEAEIARNPRARSAKLRAGERLTGPAFSGEDDLGIPRRRNMPSLQGVMS